MVLGAAETAFNGDSDPNPVRSIRSDLPGASHRCRSQYTSIAFTERLIAAGVDASADGVGDALDNAFAETTIGLYKSS